MMRNDYFHLDKLVSLEMISPQQDDMCGKIAMLVKQVRDLELSRVGFEDKLSAMLGKRYGLNFQVSIIDSPPEAVDFWTYENKYITSNIIGKANANQIIAKRETLIAKIDLKKAYISGNIQKIVIFICSTVGALIGRLGDDYILTEREFAAAILHEVGHGFNYIDYMINTVKIAATIYSRTEELMKSDKPIKIKLVNNDPELKVLPDSVKADLINTKSKNNLEVVILKGSIENLNSQMGMDYYTSRSNEQLADIFALRNGAGDAIGTLSSKWVNKVNLFDQWIKDIVSVFFTLGMSAIFCAIYSRYMFTEGETYDSDTDRLLLNKRELINQLKTVKDNKLKTHLLDAIQTYDDLYQELKNPPKGLYYYIRYLASSKYRKNVKQVNSMKEIEEMIDNDLYVLSNKLKG